MYKFRENRARDAPLWGVYIPKFGQISAKISSLGVIYPYRSTDVVMPNFTPIDATCRPCGPKNLKIGL